MSDTNKSWTEEIKVSGEELLKETEKLIHEGNVTHIVIKNSDDHVIAEFPINIGIIGIILVPMLAAIAAIAVYASHFTVVVTRVAPPAPPLLIGEAVDVPLVVVPVPATYETEIEPVTPPIVVPPADPVVVPPMPHSPEIEPPAAPVVIPPLPEHPSEGPAVENM